MLAEELIVLDGDAPLWLMARPLLHAALQLEQRDAGYSWHDWTKQQLNAFLSDLPQRCACIACVWESVPAANDTPEHDYLRLGIVCEIVAGEVRSVRTFQSLVADGLKPIQDLEPGIDDALELLRIVRTTIAPVAWALFTDIVTWNEWIFGCDESADGSDKGQILATFARQGRCVLLGSKANHHQQRGTA